MKQYRVIYIGDFGGVLGAFYQLQKSEKIVPKFEGD